MYVVIDFETTSLAEDRRATEIGLVLLDKNLQPVKTYESLIKAPVEPQKVALGKAKLSKSDLKDAPSFKDIWPEIWEFISGNLVVAHNAEFDVTVLMNELRGIGVITFPFPKICTLEWSRKLLPQLKDRELGTVCDFLKIKIERPHEALQDAKATAEVFRKFSNMNEEFDGYARSLATTTFLIDKPLWSPGVKKPRTRFELRERSESEISEIIEEIRSNQKLKLVVITGDLTIDETHFVQLCVDAGFMFKESPVTMGTALLVVGSGHGQSKIKDAQKYNRPIVSERDALTILKILAGNSR